MSNSGWRILPDLLNQEKVFQERLLEVHEQIYKDHFSNDPSCNHALDLQIRSYREIDDWVLLLLLTPWMFSRLLFPKKKPELEISDGWLEHERKEKPYQLLGPTVAMDDSDVKIRSHINYHHNLGHYLLQPIALNMLEYGSAEEVFVSWNQVINTRDENIRKFKKECSWQREISRRELFTGAKNKPS